MGRQLVDRQGVALLTATLTKRVAAADVDRRLTLQVWEREVDPTVPAERRPEQREQRLVLVDWQELTVTQGPPFRGEPEAHDPDLGQEWFRHVLPPRCVVMRPSEP